MTAVRLPHESKNRVSLAMGTIRYMTCTNCERTLGASLGSTSLKVGICKMCREDPHWLDEWPEVRESIRRSKHEYPRMGLRFKNEKPKKPPSLELDLFGSNSEPSSKRKESKVAQSVSHPPVKKSTTSNGHGDTKLLGANQENNPMGVKAGQLWRSLDKRDRDDSELGDRYVLVKFVKTDYDPPIAVVESFWSKDLKSESSIRRERQLKTTTFVPRKGRGFELVRENGYTDGSSPNNPHGVKVGQRWRALDPRRKGAVIEIRNVDEDAGVANYVDAAGQTRSVKLANFTRNKGRGYELVAL